MSAPIPPAGGRLQGLRCIVTGAAGGIGRAIVARLAADGAAVVGFDRVAAAGVEVLDVSDSAAVDSAFAAAAARMEGLDCAVTAAAVLGGTGTFPEIADADWDRYVAVNLRGTFLACRAAARLMIAAGRGGSLVTIGSVNALAAEPGAASYVASKGGVAALTRAMAVDLGPHGIRANMVAPGPITVPRNAAVFAQAAQFGAFRRQVPLGAAGRPEDVAAAVAFLAADEARFVTGTTLTVDGGLLAQILEPSG